MNSSKKYNITGWSLSFEHECRYKCFELSAYCW